jgi:hypothetical protein
MNMSKKVKRSPTARKAPPRKGPQDLGLQLGEKIMFTGRFPGRGHVIARLGDGGFRLMIDVAETQVEVEAMKKMWSLIQTSFEIHVDPPAGDEVAFMASFPTRGGAINRNGDGGARLTLDVAEEEMAPMMLLMPLIQKDLKVRIGPRLGAIPSKDSTGDGEPQVLVNSRTAEE